MATRSPTAVDWAPSRLVWEPSNLSGSHPTYGGTELGPVRGLRLDFIGRKRAMDLLVLAEEYNLFPVEGIEPGDWAILGVVYRDLDTTATQRHFPNTSGSGAVIRADVNSGTRAGDLTSARAGKVIVVPDNVTAHEGIYFPKGMPLFPPQMSDAMWSILRERDFEAAWVSLPDSNGRPYEIAKIASMTL